MTAMGHMVAAGAVLLALTGCGRTEDRAEVRALAEGFNAAVAGHRGAQACALLSRDARQALEQQESSPCARAVDHLDVAGSRAQTIRLYSTNAAVALRSGDVVYLQETPKGWRISAAGCRAPAYARPAICELQS